MHLEKLTASGIFKPLENEELVVSRSPRVCLVFERKHSTASSFAVSLWQGFSSGGFAQPRLQMPAVDSAAFLLAWVSAACAHTNRGQAEPLSAHFV